MIFSSGIVVVKQCNTDLLFLMLRNRSLWEFPKGKVDSGETFLEAAIRETREEANVSDLEFAWGLVYRETLPYTKKRKIARFYIAELKSGDPAILPNEKTGEPEHDEFRWLTYTEASELPLPDRIRDVLDWAHKTIQEHK